MCYVKNHQGKFQCVRQNHPPQVRKNENIHRGALKGTSGPMQIGADLATNLVILSPQLITLHDTDIIRFEDCYNTYRTHSLTQTTVGSMWAKRPAPTTSSNYATDSIIRSTSTNSTQKSAKKSASSTTSSSSAISTTSEESWPSTSSSEPKKTTKLSSCTPSNSASLDS